MKNYIETWHLILLITNAMLGVILFEWAWIKMYVHRNLPNQLPELHEKMAAFRRLDAHKWKKWQFYPGAMTILVPRLIFGAIFGICVVTMVSICLIGHDRSKPIPIGFRKWFLRQVYIFWSTVLSMFTFGTCIKHKYISEEKVNYYEEYLGTREE